LRRDLERFGDRLQRLVDAFDDPAVITLMLRCVSARTHLSVGGRLGEHRRVAYQRVDVRFQQYQPFVNLVMIGGFGHRCGHVAVGDFRDIRDQFG
jgi:hypothetical protein